MCVLKELFPGKAFDWCSFIMKLHWVGSLNQGATIATASSEPILKVAHLKPIFIRKLAVVSRKHLGNTHRLGGSIQLLLPPVSLY